MADQLDPRPDLWDSEARLALEALRLDPLELDALRRDVGGHPGTLRAALLEATAGRGALPATLSGTAMVGRVAAAGAASPATVDQRVVTLAPGHAVPLWLTDVSAWQGQGATVPAAGHAILSATTPLVGVPEELAVEAAVELAAWAYVPDEVVRVVGPAARVLVLGPTSVAGALATLAAVDAGAEVLAVTTSLQEARLVRALAAVEVAIGDLADPGELAGIVRDAGAGQVDVAVVATDRERAAGAAAAVTGDDGTVLLLHGQDGAGGAAALGRSLGRRPRVLTPSGVPRDGGRAALAMLRGSAALPGLLAWRCGVGPAPTASRPEEP